MMDFLRRHMRTIFLITIVGFLGGAFIGFGGYFFGDSGARDSVAEVNGTKIPYRRYAMTLSRALESVRDAKKEVTEEVVNQKKNEVLQDLIQEEVFSGVARNYGITVSDQELASNIHQYPAFQRDGRFDRNAYFQVLYQVLRTTPKEFEESQRKQIAIGKLRHLISYSVKITEPELQTEFARAHGGSMKGFEKERESFLAQLRQQKVMQVFNDWFKQLNQTVKVKVHLDEVERRG